MDIDPELTPPESSKRFDHDPSDMELACLLQSPRGLVGTTIVETDGLLRIRLASMPVTWIMLSMILGAVLISGLMILISRSDHNRPPFFEVFFWGFLAFIWLLLVPFWCAVLFVVNHQIAAKDDSVRVDAVRRTLELCEAGSTLSAADLLAITEISRFYCDRGYSGKWLPKLQTGVLVRSGDAAVELHALIDGKTRPPAAERLAGVLQLPVRRITLTKAESQALHDC